MKKLTNKINETKNSKFRIIIFIMLINMFFVSSLTLISAEYSRSLSAYTSTPTYRGPIIDQKEIKIFDREMCGAGQDFIVQISPLGCTPSLVRSDLLEEQNVHVFCPIVATQINPLIDIQSIKRISFPQNYPPEVVGIGYQPARAAIIQPKLQIDSPVFNNLGYAVIVLKQQRNESAMPDFVSGNLTVVMDYNIENAFGVGRANFYLPEMDDKKWEENYRRYSFWDGRGFIRAEDIDDINNRATILIYSDREAYTTGKSGEKRILASIPLEKGKTSREVPLPGFNYCLGSMDVTLHELEAPGTRALINVNGNYFEVKEREQFLDNKCTVTEIKKFGIIDKIKMICNEDGKKRTINLSLVPRVNLSIDGVENEFGLGDKLYDLEDKRSVYLVHIGSNDGTKKPESIYLVFVALPTGEGLTDMDFENFANYIEKLSYSNIDSDNFPEFGRSVGRFMFGKIEEGRNVISKQSFKSLAFGKEKDIFKKNIKFIGFAGPQNKDLSELEELSSDFKDYYNNTIKDFDEVIKRFSSDRDPKDPSGKKTLGENALLEKINFLSLLEQKRSALETCEIFKEKYPQLNLPQICEDQSFLSSRESSARDILILGKRYRISLESIIKPSFEEVGAQVLVKSSDGQVNVYNLTQNEVFYLDSSGKDYIQLVDLSEDSVKITYDLNSINAGKKTGTSQLRKNLPESFGSNYTLILQQVNLKKVAKVSINPKINYARSNATFSFKIGIEKRAIKLTPEQTRERIESLNKTIEKIESVNNILGTAVEVGKAACFVTGGILTAKNFYTSLSGEGIARQKVMRGPQGWFEICERKVSLKEYKNVDICLSKNSLQIDEEVKEYTKQIENLNEEIKKIQEKYKIDNGFLGEDIINTSGFMKEFVGEKYISEIKSNTLDIFENNQIKVGNVKVNVSDIILNSETLSVSDARELLLNSRLLNSDNERVRERAKYRVQAILSDIWLNSKPQTIIASIRDKLPIELKDSEVFVFTEKETQKGIYRGESMPVKFGDISLGTPYKLIGIIGGVAAGSYILTLEEIGGKYRVSKVYDLNGKEIQDENIIKEVSKFYFEKIDSSKYENQYLNPKVRYFEVGVYKGYPGVVPFDLRNGWYAATRSTLPIGGNIRAFDESGRVSSLYLCNVGINKLEEYIGGDDICELINLEIGQPYNQFPGLGSKEAIKLVGAAVMAMEEASRQYKSGIKEVIISGAGKIEVGEPIIGIPAIQCQDFMSPEECNLLFNVCDPVICPSSRCDFGGNYPVQDVVQSGVVGGLLLCLPNFPEVKVPICLSAVHAGLEAYNSVLNSYQKCLQTSLETGQTIGICDELHSIYMCEFFWNQATPIINYVVPKAVGSVLSGGSRGGGEYLTIDDAWQRASDSIDYFTQYYAANSFQAFKLRSTKEAGTEICKKWISVTGPGDGKIFQRLITPDSPPQFYGRFEEIPYTTATNPPLSQYKVFYHIYSGKDFPAYFEVYLKGSLTSFYQDTIFPRSVDRGFIPVGQYETQKRDFIAPSGYKEMCIRVNEREECGFKQVTTDFGVNYLTDLYVASQVSQTDIKTESECISGTPNLYALINPNLQAGAEEAIDPAIYNRGIIRICATDNPGKGTDSLVETKEARWKEVGYCSDPKIKCWLDTRSVKEAIRATNVKDKALGEVTTDYLEALRKEGGYISDEQFSSLISEINNAPVGERINIINQNLDKVFFNHQKGYLIFLRGNAYEELALKLYEEKKKTTPETTTRRYCIKSATSGAIFMVEDILETLDDDSLDKWCQSNGGDLICVKDLISGRFTNLKTELMFECPEDISQITKLTIKQEQPSQLQLRCSTLQECQKVLGNEIIKIAKEEKTKNGISDNSVKQNLEGTGINSFECLVLSVSYLESRISHCGQFVAGKPINFQKNNDPLYCNGNINEVIKSGGEEDSYGIMQINKAVHEDVNVADFSENVRKGVNLLIQNYNMYKSGKKYICNSKTYAGWQAALRGYNGWQTLAEDCSKGNVNYVEQVLEESNVKPIREIFSDICS